MSLSSERIRGASSLFDFQTAIQPVFTAIGAFILAGGGLAAIVFAMFKWLGERWLNTKFDERLAAYKHAQQKELEQLRFRINSLMDRTTKLHQREFDVIPEAWGRLIEAHNAVQLFIAPFQSYPDIDRMSSAQLDEFLDEAPLAQWQKNELKQQSKKLDYYRRSIHWHRLGQCKQSCREYSVYLRKNGIFMPTSLKTKFNSLDDFLWAALLEFAINEEEGILPREKEKQKALSKDGKADLEALEQEVQERLWSVQHLNGT